MRYKTFLACIIASHLHGVGVIHAVYVNKCITTISGAFNVISDCVNLTSKYILSARKPELRDSQNNKLIIQNGNKPCLYKYFLVENSLWHNWKYNCTPSCLLRLHPNVKCIFGLVFDIGAVITDFLIAAELGYSFAITDTPTNVQFGCATAATVVSVLGSVFRLPRLISYAPSCCLSKRRQKNIYSKYKLRSDEDLKELGAINTEDAGLFD